MEADRAAARPSFAFASIIVLGVALASPAVASDGVIEINQAKVIKAGGFPFTISKSGSYRLSSDLDVRSFPSPENVTAISVTTDDVTVDLNGFAIIGPSSCTASGTPTNVTCSVRGTGDGISVTYGKANITVRNGSIHGLGNEGVDAAGGENMLVDELKVYSMGGPGIDIGTGIVSRCTVKLCFNSGIGVDGYGMVTGNVVGYNGSNGIFMASGTASYNISQSNGGNGIQNTATGVVGFNSLTNNFAGLTLGPKVGYVGNVILGSSVFGSPVQIGPNLCNGSLTCP
jgi:hypothetical protein